MFLLDRPHIVAALQPVCERELGDEEQRVLRIYYSGLLRIQLNRYEQTNLGILDENLALSLGGRAAAYQNPFFRIAWRDLNEGFSEDFAKWVEERILPLSPSSC